MSSRVSFYTVSENEEGQRLDNYLLARLKGVPKSAIYKIIRKGEVRVNKGRTKPDYRVRDGDLVRIPPLRLAAQGDIPRPSSQLSERLRDAVLFDESGLLVVNKPSGLAVHGGSGVNIGMIEALRQLPEYGDYLELIHRLDRDTSGCVMVAKKRSVLRRFQECLRQRRGIAKTYLALVHGRWPSHVQLVDVPLKRFVTPSGERIVKVHQDGKPSQTEFKVVKRFDNATLVQAAPISGRTHQIRVHALHVGCPLVGDDKYGHTSTSPGPFSDVRLFLHASTLEVSLEDPFRQVFHAPLPDELEEVLAGLVSID